MTTAMRPRYLLGSAFAPLDQVQRNFRDFFGWPADESGSTALTPAMDVHEDDHNLTVTLELPGMTKDQLEVTLENGVLTVAGEKKVEREEEGKRYYAVERRSGSFRRAVSLPTDVDAAKADARFDNGVLTVTVPKTEVAKPKRLSIS